MSGRRNGKLGIALAGGGPLFAEFERAMIPERTSAGLAAGPRRGRIGGRRKKLDPAKRREIAESVFSGRKTGAEMAQLYNASLQRERADRVTHCRRAPHWARLAPRSRRDSPCQIGTCRPARLTALNRVEVALRRG